VTLGRRLLAEFLGTGFLVAGVVGSGIMRDGGGVWLGEFVATVGLLLVILMVSRGPRSHAVPVAVGLWIGGAYWFTSSTSFANPAVTIARGFTDSFAGIAPESIPVFLLAQCLAMVTAMLVVRVLRDDTR
jgi:arsenate reductase